MYSTVLFRDKTDVVGLKDRMPDAYFVGTMEKMSESARKATILCVRFSSVGSGVIANMPNLQWIVTRSHNINHINLDACRSSGVGVIALSPFINECSAYIHHYLDQQHASPPYCFYGFGSIARVVADQLNGNYDIINHSTRTKDRVAALSRCRSLIVTLPQNSETDRCLNSHVFQHLRDVTIVSISYASVFHPHDLLVALRSSQISSAVLDMAPKGNLISLLETNKLIITKHQAWNFQFNESRFFNRVYDIITSLIQGKTPPSVIVPMSKIL